MPIFRPLIGFDKEETIKIVGFGGSFRKESYSRYLLENAVNLMPENSAGVDLENSSAPLYIEVRDKNFYTFTEKIEGPGGLPLKSEGKAISLFSGGIDSPVATFMVMKRGMATDLLFCSLAHPSDTLYMLKSARNLLFKYSHGYNSNIFILDGTSR